MPIYHLMKAGCPHSHYLQWNCRPQPKHIGRHAHVAAWLDGSRGVNLCPWQLELAPAAQQVLGGLVGLLAIANLATCKAIAPNKGLTFTLHIKCIFAR